jgi:signal transduction histidine kinase
VGALGSRLSAKAKRLHVTTDPTPELLELPVQGDPQRLANILINLADNAVTFTELGSIAIRTHLAHWSGAGSEFFEKQSCKPALLPFLLGSW